MCEGNVSPLPILMGEADRLAMINHGMNLLRNVTEYEFSIIFSMIYNLKKLHIYDQVSLFCKYIYHIVLVIIIDYAGCLKIIKVLLPVYIFYIYHIINNFEWMAAMLDFCRFYGQIMGKFFGARILFKYFNLSNSMPN